MARLRTGNRRAHARQLGSHATAWRRRVTADGPVYRHWLRTLSAAPAIAAEVRCFYRVGFPADLMRRELQSLAENLRWSS